MKAIILVGGSGTRLFPLSRTNLPKQFLKIKQEKPLFIQTIERFNSIINLSDIVIVTNEKYAFHIKNELKSYKMEGVHIVIEPLQKNTAPAIGLASKFCLDVLNCDEDEVIFISPADHIIEPIELFTENVKSSIEIASKNKIVTFGIKPSKPETGYGYIKIGENVGDCYSIEGFYEKPNQEMANKYINDGNYFWNSGMFVLTIKCLMLELKLHQNDLYDLLSYEMSDVIKNFEKMPSISIDYAVAEKSDNIVIIPTIFSWSDIGSWDSIYDILDKDENNNAIKGNCVTIDCNNSLMYSQNRLVTGIGLEDIIVVETDDVILITKKGESQKVKDLVDKLKVLNCNEVNEHTTVYRPWGNYTVLHEEQNYKMKKIVVNPSERLSLQMHYHRYEHWVVVNGTGKVIIDNDEKIIYENQHVFIPSLTKHRLENCGKIPLEIIEIQYGEYLGEDDIVRFDDIYGRS